MIVRRIEQVYTDEIEIPDPFRGFNQRVKSGNLMTDEVVLLCHRLVSNKAVEHMLGLYFQPDGMYVDYKLLGVGNNSYVQATPRTVLTPGEGDFNAAYFAICHNHPGGICSPSPEDLSFTGFIDSLSKMFYMHLIDHIIVTPDSAYSCKTGTLFTIENEVITNREAKSDEEMKRRVFQQLATATNTIESMLGGDKDSIEKFKAISEVAKKNMGLAPKLVEKLIKTVEAERLDKYREELDKEIKALEEGGEI